MGKIPWLDVQYFGLLGKNSMATWDFPPKAENFGVFHLFFADFDSKSRKNRRFFTYFDSKMRKFRRFSPISTRKVDFPTRIFFSCLKVFPWLDVQYFGLLEKIFMARRSVFRATWEKFHG